MAPLLALAMALARAENVADGPLPELEVSSAAATPEPDAPEPDVPEPPVGLAAGGPSWTTMKAKMSKPAAPATSSGRGCRGRMCGSYGSPPELAQAERPGGLVRT